MGPNPDRPAPRRGLTLALLLLGVAGGGFAAWRLGVWAAGRPEQLLDVGDTQTPGLIAAGEEDVARARRAAEAARAGGDPAAAAAAAESLRVREASQAALVTGWDAQVRHARRGELAYAACGAIVGGYGLWAGGRRLRTPRATRR